MPNNHLVSVIIPHHERLAMLDELVASIPVDPRIEILIVDDHSHVAPDCSRFGRSNVKVRQLADDLRYAGSARNEGLRMATGEWVFFADSDDLIHTENFLNCLDKISSYAEDVVYTRSSSFRSDHIQATRHIPFNALLDQSAKDTNALVHFYPPWAKFIRRNLITSANIEFDPVRVSNDVMFSARLYFATQSWKILEDVTYAIREGNASLTSCPSQSSISERLKVLHQYNCLLVDHGYRGSQVPAAGQLMSIIKTSPRFAFVKAIEVWKQGQPVFFTWQHLKKQIEKRRQL